MPALKLPPEFRNMVMPPYVDFVKSVHLNTNSELLARLKVLHRIPAVPGSAHEKALIQYTMTVVWERLLRDCWAE